MCNRKKNGFVNQTCKTETLTKCIENNNEALYVHYKKKNFKCMSVC